MVLSRFQPKLAAVRRCSSANRDPSAAKPRTPLPISRCSRTIQEKCASDPQQMGIGTRIDFVAAISISPACSAANIPIRAAELSLTKKRCPAPSSRNVRLIDPAPAGSAREREKGEPIVLERPAAIPCQVAAGGAGTTDACAVALARGQPGTGAANRRPYLGRRGAADMIARRHRALVREFCDCVGVDQLGKLLQLLDAQLRDVHALVGSKAH